MALEDIERWDEKYQSNPMPDEPVKLINDYAGMATGKQALDIACGMGRHSKYLASLGFEVDGLDISSVAINHLQNIPNIHAKEVDFDSHQLPKEQYDLIVCTYFLERRLFPQMIEALKPNGIILMETFLYDPKNERKASNPDFLLKKGELEETFSQACDIVYLDEYWAEDYRGFKTMKTSMVARKKSSGD